MGERPQRTGAADNAGTDAEAFAKRARDLARAHRKRRIPRYRSLLLHWLGRALRRPRTARVAPLPTVQPGQVAVSFAGHASVLIQYAGVNIACDPMLGRWVKGIKRAVLPGLSPADLHDVDTVLISHAHADHLHRPTLAQLPRTATVIAPPQASRWLSDLGFARVVELDVDQSVQNRGVDISTAAVSHGDRRIHGLSFVIRGDGPSIYFCGDSGYFDGFADVGRRFRPDIAILPIGGYLPLSFRERHMSPLDALYALEDLGARVMIPIHYGTFALSYEQLHAPGRWLAELVSERDLQDFVVELEPGQSRVFIPPRNRRRQPQPETDATNEARHTSAVAPAEPVVAEATSTAAEATQDLAATDTSAAPQGHEPPAEMTEAPLEAAEAPKTAAEAVDVHVGRADGEELDEAPRAPAVLSAPRAELAPDAARTDKTAGEAAA